MNPLHTDALARWTHGQSARTPAQETLNGLNFDTRKIQPGDLFVALRTGKRDAHQFLPQAEQAGAAAALVEHRCMQTQLPQLLVNDTLDALHTIASAIRDQFQAPLVGITGSCGKTSTKELLAHLLGPDTLATEGNWNNFIGMPLTLTRLRPGEHTAAVVELGISQTGEMAPLAKILRPDIAIITCVTEAHLEGLGSIEGVAAEKCELAAKLPSNAIAVLPASCLKWAPFRQLRCKVLVCASMDEETPLLPAPNYELARYQSLHKADGQGCDLLLICPGKEGTSRFPLPTLSQGMLSNAVLALSVALHLGQSEENLRERLVQWKPARMRGERHNFEGTDYFIDCYNANPASMRDAVTLFRNSFPKRQRLLILGSMNELGPRAEELHKQLAKDLGQSEERYCLIGPHAQTLQAGLLAAHVPAGNIHCCADHQAARPLLEHFHHTRGAILLKGSRAYHLEELLPEALTHTSSASLSL